MAKKVKRCCICGAVFEDWDFGNNPDPISFGEEDERCCNDCNEKFVVPLRWYRLAKHDKAVLKDLEDDE